MKQLTLGWLMYVQDYDEATPRTAQCSGAPPGPCNSSQVYWLTNIDPYVKNGGSNSNDRRAKASIYVCPNYLVAAPYPTDEAGNPAYNIDPTRNNGNPPVGRRPLTSYAPNFPTTTAWWALGTTCGGENASVGN